MWHVKKLLQWHLLQRCACTSIHGLYDISKALFTVILYKRQLLKLYLAFNFHAIVFCFFLISEVKNLRVLFQLQKGPCHMCAHACRHTHMLTVWSPATASITLTACHSVLTAESDINKHALSFGLVFVFLFSLSVFLSLSLPLSLRHAHSASVHLYLCKGNHDPVSKLGWLPWQKTFSEYYGLSLNYTCCVRSACACVFSFREGFAVLQAAVGMGFSVVSLCLSVELCVGFVAGLSLMMRIPCLVDFGVDPGDLLKQLCPGFFFPHSHSLLIWGLWSVGILTVSSSAGGAADPLIYDISSPA